MPEINQLDRTYHYILKTFIEKGNAPVYTDIAREFGVSAETGKEYLHELIRTGIGVIWLEEGTDTIASFAPFHNTPTSYRITVEGEQKWSGQ